MIGHNYKCKKADAFIDNQVPQTIKNDVFVFASAEQKLMLPCSGRKENWVFGDDARHFPER